MTNAEMAILSLVVEGEKYGYQIEQLIQQRGMREWTEIGFSSIYYILNKLEAAGWLNSQLQPGSDRPARKMYVLTPDGIQAYLSAVATRLSQPRPRSADFDLALGGMLLLPQDEIYNHLETYHAHLSQQVELVHARWQRDRQAPGFPWSADELFNHSIATLESELAWVNGLITRLHSLKKEFSMTAKIDLYTELKDLYQPSPKAPVIVDVPPIQFLMLDGSGDPNTSPVYQEALNCLYSFSYTLKFGIKKAEGIEYKVMPLEGLWWAEDMENFLTGAKSKWLWTMMIAQPTPVTVEWVEKVRTQLMAKRDSSPMISQVRFETYQEGTSVQIMHIGPYSAEGPNVQRIHEHAASQGYHLSGKHHEIYLGDPRRAAPEKLRTVLRQPIAR